MSPAFTELFRECDDERRFAGSADSQISDADNGMIEPNGSQYPRVVKLLTGPNQKVKSPAHRPAPIG